MAKTPPLSPSNIAREIEEQSRKVGELATLLSNRIIVFENWLNDMPGRVEATVWVPAANVDEADFREFSFGLRLGRIDKRWILFYDYCEPGDDETWKPLSEANLDVKMEASAVLPRLLDAIKDAQQNRVSQLLASHAKFAAMAKDIGLNLDMEGK